MTSISVRHVHRGTSQMRWATTVANTSAPTVAEINAATDLTPYIAGLSGWRIADQVAQLPVTQSDYGSMLTIRATRVVEGIPTLIMYDEGTVTETIRDTTLVEDATGYMIWLPYGDPVAGERCEVWPLESLGPKDRPAAVTAAATFEVGFAIWGLPIDPATVAA